MFLYAVLEKAQKECWVLRDSYKRSHDALLQTLERTQRPSFVVDIDGAILYFNEAAKTQILSKYKNRPAPANLLSMAKHS